MPQMHRQTYEMLPKNDKIQKFAFFIHWFVPAKYCLSTSGLQVPKYVRTSFPICLMSVWRLYWHVPDNSPPTVRLIGSHLVNSPGNADIDGMFSFADFSALLLGSQPHLLCGTIMGVSLCPEST